MGVDTIYQTICPSVLAPQDK